MKWGPVALTPAARMLHQQRGCSKSSEDAPGAVRMLHGQGGLSKSIEDAPWAVRMLHKQQGCSTGREDAPPAPSPDAAEEPRGAGSSWGGLATT